MSDPLFVGCDPGKKPGFAAYRGWSFLGYGRKLTDLPNGWRGCDWFIVEDQQDRGVMSASSLRSLVRRAGYLAAKAEAQRIAVVPVHVWRNALWARSGTVPKDTIIARLRERYGNPDVTPDELEARGIAEAALTIDLDMYRWKP